MHQATKFTILLVVALTQCGLLAASRRTASRSISSSSHKSWGKLPRETELRDDSNSVYLAFHGAGGLTNQRLCFISGLIAAAAEKFVLVLPSWHERKFEMAGTIVSENVIYPFEHFYKKEPFAQFAAQYNFSIADAVPTTRSQACIAQLSAIDSATPSYDTVQQWSKAYGVVCMTPGNMFFHPSGLWNDKPAPAELWDNAVNAFEPSDLFASAIDKAIQAMPTETFVTVHVRVEEDMQIHCRSHHGDAGSNFHDGRRCALWQQDYITALQSTGVPSGTTLFIASGSSLEELQELCTAFVCFDQTSLGSADSFSYMEKAFFDYSMAEQGSAFYGSMSSTFSMQLYGSFAARKKPAYYANPYCPNGKLHCG